MIKYTKSKLITGVLGSFAFAAMLQVATDQQPYDVKVQWGGDTAPWNDDGTWKMGRQAPIELNLFSGDGGKTLMGQVR